MFCAFTRPRYQVSVYSTTGPLVITYHGIAFVNLRPSNNKINNEHIVHHILTGFNKVFATEKYVY